MDAGNLLSPASPIPLNLSCPWQQNNLLPHPHPHPETIKGEGRLALQGSMMHHLHLRCVSTPLLFPMLSNDHIQILSSETKGQTNFPLAAQTPPSVMKISHLETSTLPLPSPLTHSHPPGESVTGKRILFLGPLIAGKVTGLDFPVFRCWMPAWQQVHMDCRFPSCHPGSGLCCCQGSLTTSREGLGSLTRL